MPREHFFGAGPWRIIPPKCTDGEYFTPDADPRWLYHDVLVTIDQARDLNNGEPGLWARLLDHFDLRPAERVMQIGAGTGYYTAVLAEMVGPGGQVVAVEYDAELAARARDNLARWPQVEVVHGDGTAYDPGEIDGVIAFAGATHPAPVWLDRLKENGRLLMPLTGDDTWGFFLRAVRHGSDFEAVSLGRCGFFHCVGGRDAEAVQRLQRALRRLRGGPVPVKALHRGELPPKAGRRVWYVGRDCWLSREALPRRT